MNLAQKIQPHIEQMLTFTPPLKGAASRCTLASSPIHRDCVWGICEVGKGAEGEFGEVNGQDMLGCFGVLSMELRHESPRTFDIFGWSPFIFLYAVSFPMYEGFYFPSEDLAV